MIDWPEHLAWQRRALERQIERKTTAAARQVLIAGYVSPKHMRVLRELKAELAILKCVEREAMRLESEGEVW
jgi:hypothetical protein